MKTSTWLKGVMMAALLPLLAGCVAYPAPPPPRSDVIVAPPGPTSVWLWIPGSWDWHGHWVWRSGRWARRPYRGAEWASPHWAGHFHHRHWEEGHWH